MSEAAKLTQILDVFPQIALLVPKLAYLSTRLAQNFTELLSALTCPFSIFQNFQICGTYFISDKLAFTIWGIIYIICYVLIGIPLWCWSSLLSLFTGIENYIQSPSDVCPTKDDFCLLVETIYKYFSGKHLLYRTEDDLSKCYCFVAIRTWFDPYVSYYDVSVSTAAKKQKPTKGVMKSYITAAIVIMLFIFIYTAFIFLTSIQTIKLTSIGNPVDLTPASIPVASVASPIPIPSGNVKGLSATMPFDPKDMKYIEQLVKK